MCCALCVEIQKDSMTLREAARAYSEIVVSREHEEELQDILVEKYGLDNLFDELVKVDQELEDKK